MMKKSEDVFFETVLRNSCAILREARQQKELQNARLHRRHSSDWTADAAIDNLWGGQMTIDSKGDMIRLRNVRSWAQIIGQAEKHFREDKISNTVMQLVYFAGLNNGKALKVSKVSRQKFFQAKDDIKNYVRAAACEMGIWRVLANRMQ